MKRFRGIGASQGIAIGRVAFLENPCVLSVPESQMRSSNAAQERKRLDHALTVARQSLEHLRQRVLLEVGAEEASIIEVQQMMLDDIDMYEEMVALIEFGQCTAEYAVQTVGRHAIDQIASLEDSYLRERAADIKDINHRLQNILCGNRPHDPIELGGQFVVVSTDLLPSTMVQIDPRKVLAVICRDGSEVSHAAIIARTMGIPAVLRIGREPFHMLNLYDTVIVDGFRGELVVEPDERTLAHYRHVRQQYLDNRASLKRLRGLPNRTADGMDVTISADVGNLRDVKAALEYDAHAIGLFRCQLFSVSGVDEKEQEQFEIYRELLRAVGKNGRASVKTVEFGMDPDQWLLLTQKKRQENPPLLPMHLSKTSPFAIQLRALLRASSFGKLAIVFPMVTCVEQMETAHAMLQSCAHDLDALDIPRGYPEIGILIDSPAATLIADQLVWMADFFLIDLDNLSHFIATDRSSKKNSTVSYLRHPAVTKAVQMVVDAASRRNIRCGICGQVASDPDRVEDFLAIGVREFVVPPPQVLAIREKVREIDLGKRQWKIEDLSD